MLRNKGDPAAVREAKQKVLDGRVTVSQKLQQWLFGPKEKRKNGGLPKDSLQRYSNVKPPVVLDAETVRQAIAQLSLDPKLKSLIQRVGSDSLMRNIGEPKAPTKASLFDHCLRAITFTMVSVAAGNSFLRKLSIKIAICLEMLPFPKRQNILKKALLEMNEENNDYDDMTRESLFECLIKGESKKFLFCMSLLKPLVETCEYENGKRTGYPHL